MNANTIRVYEILKAHWGEKEATDVLDNETTLKVKRTVENKIGHLATKEDISDIKKDVSKLEISIANNYANIIKWMFIFWIGTTGTIIAIIKLL